jgi:hypothetical protein
LSSSPNRDTVVGLAEALLTALLHAVGAGRVVGLRVISGNIASVAVRGGQ